MEIKRKGARLISQKIKKVNKWREREKERKVGGKKI
jgi:hypothetical protein